jgi:hypothetical protein
MCITDKAHREQFQAAIGQRIVDIDVRGKGTCFVLTLDNGVTLRFEQAGGELDGHFDPPSAKSLRVTLQESH